MSKQQVENFAGINGMGTALLNRSLPHGKYLWEGPMTLKDGTHVRVECLGNPDEGYDCKIKRPPTEADRDAGRTQWDLLALFAIPSFEGSKRPHRIKTEITGPMLAYPSRTRADETCIRFQQLSTVAV